MTELSLSTLKRHPRSRRQARRVGRGNGSKGTYSGRGMKGQRSRTGGRRGLIRRSLKSLMDRVAKQRGFRSLRPKFIVVNVGALQAAYRDGEVVTRETLQSTGLIARHGAAVKILGEGELTRRLTVRVHSCSASARKAIEKAGGEVVLLARSQEPTEEKA